MHNLAIKVSYIHTKSYLGGSLCPDFATWGVCDFEKRLLLMAFCSKRI